MVDVAARAGVSTATVSRALRDVPGVSEATRRRIRRIADELAYVVSPEASALSVRRTGRVAVVVERLEAWFYATMLAGLERVFRDAGLDVLVFQVSGADQRAHFFGELPARRKVDALVLVALPLRQPEIDRLDLHGVHVVTVGSPVGDYAHVGVDDHAVGVMATRHLLELGHRRIVIARTDDTAGAPWSADAERLRGYEDAMDSAGLGHARRAVTVPYCADAGTVVAPEVLALEPQPTAVVAYSDEIGIGLVHELRRGGCRVPEDLSVVGVDDHPMARVCGLTTVAQHAAEQARLAGETALGLLGSADHAGRALLLQPELVLRETTAPPGR